MIKYLFTIIFLIIVFKTTFSQTENFNYTVYYHWGPVWVNGGTLNLYSEEITQRGESIIKLTGSGISSPRWNWLFEINDHYTSICRKKDLLPLTSVKDTYEAGDKTDNTYIFDYSNSKVYIKTKMNSDPVKYDTLILDRPIYDAQCATAYLRFMDLDNHQSGDTIKLNLLMNGELMEQDFVVRKDVRLKDKDDKNYEVLLFTAIIEENSLFSSSEAIKVWVTDDAKRVPLKIKADLKVGSIEVLYNNIRFKKPK
jgi:hypothetical protein